MFQSSELPNCFCSTKTTLVGPKWPTPNHTLYLSNLDDQKFLRFSIKYLYLYTKSIPSDALKSSLSRVLVDYYPLAGRLRISKENEDKLEVDCNAEGAIFAEALMDFTAEEFLRVSSKPDRSWRKLLHRVEATSFLGVPPLVVQVTYLRCGGMILCTAINHCLADGIGTSQFLHAWAHFTTRPATGLSITAVHSRLALRPRLPPNIAFPHREFIAPLPGVDHPPALDLTHFLQSQPLIPTSFTFTSSLLLRLKQLCVPSLKCTSFEALASHVWRSWVRALGLPHAQKVKLLFSVNVRSRLEPRLPEGYYGNGFVLACAETTARELVSANMRHGVRLVQEGKESMSDGYVRSMVDFLEERRAKPDLTASLVISQWAKMGLEELDFGEGRPVHMGPLASEIYCLFLPVVGEVDATRVLISMPESLVDKFEYCMWNLEEKEGGKVGDREE